MFPAYERDRFAEPRPVLFDQSPPVLVFLCGHVVEDLGRLRILVTQTICISLVDAGIVLLGGNRKRQDFLFGKG